MILGVFSVWEINIQIACWLKVQFGDMLQGAYVRALSAGQS